MNLIRVAVLGLSLLLVSACKPVPSAPIPQPTPQAIRAKQTLSVPRASTVKLVDASGNGFCSGVVFKKDKVLTAAHCDIGDIFVDGIKATVIKKDVVNDIMLLEVQTDLRPIALATFKLSLDQKLTVIGFPINSLMFKAIVTFGNFMGVEGNRLIMTAPIAPGNSGGPVFATDNQGRYRVVGIAVEVAGSYYGPISHLSRAVALKTIKEFLRGQS